MLEDRELLRRYAEEKSEAAFAELVRRQVNFVYACALRRVGGDAHLAEDVTQHVFTALARDAATLAQREVLSGWFFTTARNASAQIVRTERRRQIRETEAQLMNELTSTSAHDAEWERLRPVLDDALDGLSDDDRQAVLLRFFEGKSFAEVGLRLRSTENTARMRVDRALDKLHALLSRRGLTSTTAALAVALANQAGVAAPAGLAASVTGVALASGGAAAGLGASAWTLFMGVTKLQVGIVGALAVAGATGYVMQADTNAGLRREIAAVQEQRLAVAALRMENQRLASAAAEVETLRQDDLELKQLEQRAVEIKTAAAEKARLAKASAQNRRKELEDDIREKDRLAQLEVDRMNREGNKLVGEYKALMESAKNDTLTGEARAQADTAAKAKLEEIKNKQREIQTFIENTRRVLSDRVAEVRRLYPDGGESNFVPLSSQPTGRLELRRSPPIDLSPANNLPPVSVRGEISSAVRVAADSDRVSMRLPQADQATALAAYEKLAGVRIVRDPSMATISGTLDFQTPPVTRAEASQTLRAALRNQLNIVLEPGPDGTLIAKPGPPR